LEVLLRYGVNHIDTAARYGDSELRIGPWMARHRRDFFLATKTGSRTAREGREDLHRSLERLRVDHVDLIQLHSLGHPDDWDQAMGPGGALEALIDARQQGLARFIGVTGHGWTIAAMHRRSLARFDFDAVLLPYNFFMAQQERYRRAFEEVLGFCRARNAAVRVIKSIARRPWATRPESDLTRPRRIGDLAPARADPLELARRQSAGLQQRRVLLPSPRLRGPDDRSVDTRHAQREAQRGGHARVRGISQEWIVQRPQAGPVGLVVGLGR